MRTPINKAHGHAVKSQVSVGSAVTHLFGASGPLYVAGLVMMFILDSLNRMLGGWSRANVLIEGLERFEPSLTHLDATTAVILKRLVFSAVAPIFDGLPCFVLGRVSHSVSPTKTSAGSALACSQIAGSNIGDCAASASTFPNVATVSIQTKERFDNQPCKSLSNLYTEGNRHAHSPYPSVNVLARLVELFSQFFGPSYFTTNSSERGRYFAAACGVSGEW